MSSDLTDLLNAAFTSHQAGDLGEASRQYRDILQRYPLQADSLHMLGVIAKQQGDHERALKLIEIALGQNTTMALAWHNRSLLLRQMGRKDEARLSAEQAVALDASFADSWDMLGFLWREKGDFERARACHGQAVGLQPDNLKFLANYALLLLATGELAAAYDVMRQVDRISPGFSCHTTGNILKAAGYTDLALPYFRQSSRQYPGNDEIRVTEAMAHLQIGDFAEGWRLWETRPSLDPRFSHVPFWHGDRVGHLLVHEDQGLGDALQCARYISQLEKYAKRITIQVTGALYTLFKASFPDHEILTLDDPVPLADGRMRMLSLPAFFGATVKTVPCHIPYLHAQESWRAPWRERLAKTPKPRIGLVWGGNPGHLNDRLRSMAADPIIPMLQGCGAHLVSLQKGAQKQDIDRYAYDIFDADPFLQDFSDTAGLLAELDLLISVDTSVVHLAGALGKPVWVMLPFDPDWRWLLGREDSPWYPTARLFRQQQPRDWNHVTARVSAELQRFIGGDPSVLQPTPWGADCLQRNPHPFPLPGLPS